MANLRWHKVPPAYNSKGMVMSTQPTLKTKRLILRPMTPEDALPVQRLAGDRAIARTTLSIPHPYNIEMARTWIETQRLKYKAGKLVNFAIVHQQEDTLLGVIGLTLTPTHDHAELGYWIGKPYWGQGYATEAAAAVLRFGFETLRLHRIHAAFMAHNPASGRVMEKIGMVYEGTLRQHLKKWCHFYDVVKYGILKSDYDTLRLRPGKGPQRSGDAPVK